MNMVAVRKKAKALGLRTCAPRKADLIRTIQVAEGNFDCFGTAETCCDQRRCCWREDCLDKGKQTVPLRARGR